MKTMVKTLCEASGVGGCGNIAEVIIKQMRPYADEICTDALGNVIAVKRCGVDDAPLLLLEAHMDEIGFIVTHVDDDGFVHVSNCGGIDRRVLAATEVTLLTDPVMNGVFCSTPPHLADDDRKVKALEEMGIDVGLAAEDAKARIPVGTRVMFRSQFSELSEYRVSDKALDNRIGCASVVRAMQLLDNETLSCDVAAVFAVQEEIGGAGAKTASFGLKASAAIATDVSFAATPDAPSHKCGKLGKGPMLGMSPCLDREMTNQLKALADKHDISIQYEVMGGGSGTDADWITVAGEGMKTALLSVPQRYMHTPVEMVDLRDAENVAQLMAYYAKEGMTSC